MNHIEKDPFTDLNDRFFDIRGQALNLMEKCSDMAANVLADLDVEDYMSALNACRIYYTAERAVYGSSIAFFGLQGPIWAQTNSLCQLEVSRLKIWGERLKSISEADLYPRRYDLFEAGINNQLREVPCQINLQDLWDNMFLRAAVMRRLAADIGEKMVLKNKTYKGEIEPFLTEANRSRKAKEWYERGESAWFGKIRTVTTDEEEKEYVITRPDSQTGECIAYHLACRCYKGPDQAGALEAIRWAILNEMFVFGPDGKEISALEYDRLKVPMGQLAMQKTKQTVSTIMSEEYDPLE